MAINSKKKTKWLAFKNMKFVSFEMPVNSRNKQKWLAVLKFLPLFI